LIALQIQLNALREQIRILDRRILGWQRTNETAKRLGALPGVGPALATALVASIADPKAFRTGRDFSASLFTVGALSVIKYASWSAHSSEADLPRRSTGQDEYR
jgi:hypothetical protein